MPMKKMKTADRRAPEVGAELEIELNDRRLTSKGFDWIDGFVGARAGIVLDEFEVSWVRVRVNKPGAIRGARDVGVLIERGTRPDAG